MADEPKPTNWVPNRKPTIGLVSVQIMAVASWAIEPLVHVSMPPSVQLSAAGIIAFCMMYIFREPE